MAFASNRVPTRAPPSHRPSLQVVAVSWLTATVFFLATYLSPCLPLPPKEQLLYFEAGQGEDQDFYAGIAGADSRGLRHFPQLWCAL